MAQTAASGPLAAWQQCSFFFRAWCLCQGLWSCACLCVAFACRVLCGRVRRCDIPGELTPQVISNRGGSSATFP